MINLFFYVYHKKDAIDGLFALCIVKILLIGKMLLNVKSGGVRRRKSCLSRQICIFLGYIKEN